MLLYLSMIQVALRRRRVTERPLEGTSWASSFFLFLFWQENAPFHFGVFPSRYILCISRFFSRVFLNLLLFRNQGARCHLLTVRYFLIFLDKWWSISSISLLTLLWTIYNRWLLNSSLNSSLPPSLMACAKIFLVLIKDIFPLLFLFSFWVATSIIWNTGPGNHGSSPFVPPLSLVYSKLHLSIFFLFWSLSLSSPRWFQTPPFREPPAARSAVPEVSLY